MQIKFPIADDSDEEDKSDDDIDQSSDEHEQE